MVKHNPIRRILSRVKLNRVQKVLLIGLLVWASWAQLYEMALKGRAKLDSREPVIATLVESNLKKIDPNALTDQGIIRSFRIDTDKSEFSERGLALGWKLKLHVIINDNEAYQATYVIDYDRFRFPDSISSFRFNDELEELTKELRR